MRDDRLILCTAIAVLMACPGIQAWTGVLHGKNGIAQAGSVNSFAAPSDRDNRYVKITGYASSGKMIGRDADSTTTIQNGVSSVFTTLQPAKYTIIDLGTDGWFTATHINDSGQVIGYRHFDGKGQQPFLYENGHFIDLLTFEIYPRGINDQGQVVGSNNNRDILIFYDRSVSNLGSLGMNSPEPNGINNNTQIVGVNSLPPFGSGYNAFLIDGDNLLYIYNLTDPQQTVAHDINNHNQVVGRIDVGLDPEDEENIEGFSGQSFIYDNGNMTFFGDPGRDTQAYSINDLGQAAGGSNQFDRVGSEYHAFLYKNGSMVNIDTLNSHRSLAISVNSFGQVVGLFTPPSLEYSHAFIFDNNAMVDLNDLIDPQSGWDYLEEATDINNNGQIVGIGYINGESHTYLLDPVKTCGLNSIFRTTTIEENRKYYTDRDYRITAVPSRYIGMQMIETPNDHRHLTVASGYITFKMPYDGYVFVAYDDKVDREPDWLGDFNDTGDFLETSLTISPAHRLYSRIYGKNVCVSLGGNRGPGFSGDEKVSNYIVLYHPAGSLQVTLVPEDAAISGAKWRVDGGDWYTSGQIQRDLLAGDHTVEFNTAVNWNPPEKMKVTIKQEQTTKITAAYEVPTGSLKVTIAPSEAVSAGAQWRIDGGEWHDSGETESKLSAGNHTLECKEVSGWIAPKDHEVTIYEGQTMAFTGTYEEDRVVSPETATPSDSGGGGCFINSVQFSAMTWISDSGKKGSSQHFRLL